MLHYYHNHNAVTATSASSDLSSSESWSTCGGTGGSSYINSSKYVREKQKQQQQQQSTASSAEALERMIVRLASENAVVIFSNTTCCMCHAVKSLLCGMGVNPTVYEIDQLVDPTVAKHIERALLRLILANYQQPPPANSTNGVAPVPVVFIGGKLLGPTDRVMASHINGTLVPLLKQAGALWL